MLASAMAVAMVSFAVPTSANLAFSASMLSPPSSASPARIAADCAEPSESMVTMRLRRWSVISCVRKLAHAPAISCKKTPASLTRKAYVPYARSRTAP